MELKQNATVTIMIAAAVESAVNAALQYDPASKRAVSELTDILAIEVISAKASAITLFCQGTSHGLSVTGYCESPVTTRLTGSPAALFELLNRPHSLASSDVQLSGDIALLKRWQAILDNLDIDWQSCLQDYLGDIVGPIAAAAIGKTGNWLKHQSRYHQHQLRVYLQEELRAVPGKAEFDNFYRQVDELVLSTDRLEARLQLLQKKLSQEELPAKLPINTAHGHQQVSNGSREEKNQKQPNELLAADQHEQLDTGTQKAASRTDQNMETVAAVNRATD